MVGIAHHVAALIVKKCKLLTGLFEGCPRSLVSIKIYGTRYSNRSLVMVENRVTGSNTVETRHALSLQPKPPHHNFKTLNPKLNIP